MLPLVERSECMYNMCDIIRASMYTHRRSLPSQIRYGATGLVGRARVAG